MGVSDAWIKQFEGIAIAPPEWYESADTFDYYRFNRSLNRTIHSASRVMNSVPQSSGGSSSGGGFSGGGFSGGGFRGGGLRLCLRLCPGRGGLGFFAHSSAS